MGRTKHGTPRGPSSTPSWDGQGAGRREATWRLASCPSYGGTDKVILFYSSADKGDAAAREPFVPIRNVGESYFCNYGCEDIIFANDVPNSTI